MTRCATGASSTKPRCASHLRASMISSKRSGRRGFFGRRHEHHGRFARRAATSNPPHSAGRQDSGQISHRDRHGFAPNVLASIADIRSLWFGTALIAIGVGVNLFSARRYARLVGELNRGQFVYRSPSRGAVIVALFLALLGIAMTIYLTLVLAQPPDTLHP